MTEENKQPEKVNPLGCLILILLVGSPFVACSMFSSQTGFQSSSSSTSIANVPASERTPEQNLALIDGRTGQGAEQPYASLLDQVQPKCNESRKKIADMTVAVVTVLKDEGKSTDNLDMLTGLRNATAEEARSQDCSQVYSLIARIMLGEK